MTEEIKQAVTEQEIGSPVESARDEAVSKEPKEGSKEFNFRRLEQEKKDMEKRLREQEQLNQNMKAALENITKPQQPQDDLPQLSDDDIPEWRHVKNYAERLAEQKVRQLLEEKERAALPERAKSRFSDFEQVVNEENISKLEQEHPELAQALVKANDPYSATYKIIKQFYGQKKSDPVLKEEVEKLEQNSKKPLSSNAVSQGGALKGANAFQKKSREELYKEMIFYANQM